MYMDFDFKNLTCDTINRLKLEIINDVTNTINSIVRLTEKRIFDNTIQPLINILTLTEPKLYSFAYAKNFYTDKQVRENGSLAETEIDKFFIECFMRRDFYDALSEYQNMTYSEENRILHPEENRYFDYLMKKLKRNGLHLNDNDYMRFKNITKEISELTSDFSKNIIEENTCLFFTKPELEGLPNYWLTDDKIINDEVKVTLKYPDYFPVMKYAKNEEVRKTFFTAYNKKCASTNTQLMEKVIRLRYEMAQILGYDTYADYRTEINVIGTAKNAINFENNMNDLFTDPYKKDMNDLINFAKSYDENPLIKDQLDPWDFPYYMRVFTEKECDLNMEALRKYFPLEKVKDGLFKIYQMLFGLRFEVIDTDNKWHDDVTLYKVSDSTTNDLMGYFYLDMYSREGKFSHAGAFTFVSGCDLSKVTGNNSRRPHVVTIACNFPKDGCIDFSDVKTFFHEFGHVMHQICSKTYIYHFMSFFVETDFLETPSQLLENWCYDKTVLELMSEHTETKESISQDIIDKLKKSKNFLSSYHYKRQLNFGIFDQKIHTMKFKNIDEPINLQEIWYQTEEEVLGTKPFVQLYPFAIFNHVMNGYDASYYGYLKSETMASNIFQKMFNNGSLLDVEKGMNYRKQILEPGATKDAMELLRGYLNEEPNDKYFLEDKIINS
jgi:Zn-dependent oligopeptidase